MNKTIDISLAGILFHLEENAYYKLKKYLKAVRQSIGQTEDVEEVMHEIEARIAELLMQKQPNLQYVINEKHIEEVITVLGQPEDFEEDIQPDDIQASQKTKKALFRDMDHSMIAGIAAGFAHYVGMDVTLMRLIFVALFFITHGSFILFYLLLWIIVPKAKTASDKLRMKGESANLDNIVDQVTTDETGKKKVNIGETIETTGSEIGNVLVKIIGFVLVLFTGILLFGLIVSAVSFSPFSDLNLVLHDNPIFHHLHIPVGFIGFLTFFVIGFPITLLFILGFKMLFPHTKPFNKNLLIIIGTLWFVTLTYMSVKSISFLSHKNTKARIVSLNRQWLSEKDTLLIDVKTVKNLNNYTTSNNIKYKFKPSEDSLFHLKIIKIAEGITYKKALKNAKEIEFDMTRDTLQNKLVFNSVIRFPTGNLVSSRKVWIYVEVPEGKLVKLSEPVSHLTNLSDCEFPALLTNKNTEIICLKQYENMTDEPFNLNINGDKVKIKIGDNGLEINSQDESEAAKIKIDDNGIDINAEEGNKKSSVHIDDNGVKIENNR